MTDLSRTAILSRYWRGSVIGTVDHVEVNERVHDDAGWTARYLFMTTMSAGIAVLGLLLSSPAVVIGAMLISPLMGPIIGLGFALATVDARQIRRAAFALSAGSLLAVLFCAALVLVSPLQNVTSEIAARTRPTCSTSSSPSSPRWRAVMRRSAGAREPSSGSRSPPR